MASQTSSTEVVLENSQAAKVLSPKKFTVNPAMKVQFSGSGRFKLSGSELLESKFNSEER